MYFENESDFKNSTWEQITKALADFTADYDIEYNKNGHMWVGEASIATSMQHIILPLRTAEDQTELTFPISYLWCPDWIYVHDTYVADLREEHDRQVLERTKAQLAKRKKERYKLYLELKEEFES